MTVGTLRYFHGTRLVTANTRLADAQDRVSSFACSTYLSWLIRSTKRCWIKIYFRVRKATTGHGAATTLDQELNAFGGTNRTDRANLSFARGAAAQ